MSGEIPAELGNLRNLYRLDLAGNQLSGEIPSELGNLLYLQRLDLANNQLSGEIPAELGNLLNLYRLDLADNRLSGEIPVELGTIPNLRLDGNELSGRILRPNGTNPQYAWEGLTIRVTWDAVEGADYYKVYHDDVTDSVCSLDIFDGSPKFCEELAADVAGTTFVHTNPDLDANYYWVVACNQEGCSEIDLSNLASANPDHARYRDRVLPTATNGCTTYGDKPSAHRPIRGVDNHAELLGLVSERWRSVIGLSTDVRHSEERMRGGWTTSFI